MKSLKGQLIAAIAMTLVAIVTISSSTYAWFAMNSTISATGMSVKAKAAGSLIVGSVSGATRSTNYPVRNSGNTAAAFTAEAVSLYDCTHSESSGSGSKGLKTLDSTSRKNVDINEGTISTPTYGEVGSSGYPVSDYFIDYVLYVASSTDTAITTSSITVKFSNVTSDAAFKNAIAVDWYIGGDDITNFKKTTHLSDTTAVELLSSSESITIPAAAQTTGTPEASKKIVMRVYIDGAVTGGTTGVSNKNYSTANISFDVEIAAN